MIDTIEKKDEKNKVIFYIHGGAFVLGEPFSPIIHWMSLNLPSSISIYSVEYTLAPDAKFPHQLHEIYENYKYLLKEKNISEKEVIIMGESAGGNLSLAFVNYLQSLQLPLPAALVLYSPWIDLSLSSPYYIENSSNDALFSGALEKFPIISNLYLTGNYPNNNLNSQKLFSSKAASNNQNSYSISVENNKELMKNNNTDNNNNNEEINNEIEILKKNWLVSPIFANNEQLKQLPPILLFAGTHEMLFGDSLTLYHSLLKMNSESESRSDIDRIQFIKGEKLFHCWPLCSNLLPESKSSLQLSSRFIRRIFELPN